MQQPTFEELTTATNKIREEKINKNIERFKIAREDAKNHITEGCYEKMMNSANKGFNKTDIYSFLWESDPKAIVDSKGNKIIFEGNVRLLDILIKGKDEFINDLNNFFNKDGETKYHCGFYKKNTTIPNESIWNIYVSWAVRENKVQNDFERGRCERGERGGRGGRGGRGIRGGRGGRGGRGYTQTETNEDRGGKNFYQDL